MDIPATLSAPARFAQIIVGLCAALNWRRDAARTEELISYIVRRVETINRRFQRLAALIAAGKLPPEPPYKPRPAREDAPLPDPEGARAPKPPRPEPRVPWCFGWMSVIAPIEAGENCAMASAVRLRGLLEDPEMRALLEATPRMVRLLRPLCHGLGIPASVLPALPPRPRRQRPPKLNIMAVINNLDDRPWPINGRGGPPFMPGESPRGGFLARTVRGWGGKPPDFSRSG
jgi:hypothetical protein